MRSWFLSSHTAKNNSVAKEKESGFHRFAPDLQILALFSHANAGNRLQHFLD
ncbi:hypothetical protein HMPREF9086_2327 [Enterobacter hormaechei ATCC 49162]|nr:hypothetical protein HMPREF9086_2327 [Enterobacter hormaechei ATCC 49162]